MVPPAPQRLPLLAQRTLPQQGDLEGGYAGGLLPPSLSERLASCQSLSLSMPARFPWLYLLPLAFLCKAGSSAHLPSLCSPSPSAGPPKLASEPAWIPHLPFPCHRTRYPDSCLAAWASRCCQHSAAKYTSMRSWCPPALLNPPLSAL